MSPLVGYDDVAVASTFNNNNNNNGNRDNNNNGNAPTQAKVVALHLLNELNERQRTCSIAIVQYPALCIFSMAMVCSYDYGYMTLALFFALLCGNVLHNVLIQQRRYLCHSSSNLRRRQRQRQQQQQQQGQGTMLDGSKEDEEYEKDDEDDFYFDDFSILAGRQNRSVDVAASEDGRDDDDDDGHGGSSSSSSSSSGRVLQYMAVRLPFELYAGYILSLCTVYLNAAIINNATPTWVYLLIANLCLVGLLGIGCILLWRGRVYGIGISLIWYLVSFRHGNLYMCVWLYTP